ncbi:MAG: hypothetical protein D6725_13575, partial [Planctomycetota bacterium]
MTVDDRFETARCAACGTTLAQGGKPAQTQSAVQRARELLDRWASPDFDPFGPLLPDEFSSAAQPDRSDEKPRPHESDAAAGETTRRTIHRPHADRPPQPLGTGLFVNAPPPGARESGGPRADGAASTGPNAPHIGMPPTEPPPRSERRLTESDAPQHAPEAVFPPGASSGPGVPRSPSGLGVATADGSRSAHREPKTPPAGDSSDDQEMALMANSAASEKPRTNWMGTLGQLLAYTGVLGLTVGTLLVIQSYFGGSNEYGPTGWLILTAGQMLLFLGVVTMVSSGMEQAADEMGRRVDRLGEH